jgi:hypothetical protein
VFDWRDSLDRQRRDQHLIETDRPVSRQHEVDYCAYYGMPYYWAGPCRWGDWAMPADYATGTPLAAFPAAAAMPADARESGDPHLRSIKQVTGYYFKATDGDIGHVEDFLVDERDWAIRYMIVDTRNWLPGKHVLVAPEWVDRISWSDSTVYMSLPRAQIENSPEYNPARPLDRADESRLYDYYGRPRYWDRERDRAA